VQPELTWASWSPPSSPAHSSQLHTQRYGLHHFGWTPSSSSERNLSAGSLLEPKHVQAAHALGRSSGLGSSCILWQLLIGAVRKRQVELQGAQEACSGRGPWQSAGSEVPQHSAWWYKMTKQRCRELSIAHVRRSRCGHFLCSRRSRCPSCLLGCYCCAGMQCNSHILVAFCGHQTLSRFVQRRLHSRLLLLLLLPLLALVWPALRECASSSTGGGVITRMWGTPAALACWIMVLMAIW